MATITNVLNNPADAIRSLNPYANPTAHKSTCRLHLSKYYNIKQEEAHGIFHSENYSLHRKFINKWSGAKP